MPMSCEDYEPMNDDKPWPLTIWTGRVAVAVLILAILYAAVHGWGPSPKGQGRPLGVPTDQP